MLSHENSYLNPNPSMHVCAYTHMQTHTRAPLHISQIKADGNVRERDNHLQPSSQKHWF